MTFLNELKRRGVFQAGVAYVLFGWLMVQVSDIVLPTFEAPSWVMKAIILLLLCGFPIAMLLAWFFDLTTRGMLRTEEVASDASISKFPAHFVNYVIISLLAAAVLLFAMDKFVWQTEFAATRSNTPVSIAVLPFDNISGDADTDPFTAGIHDDLLTQLSKISALRTLSRTSVLRYSEGDRSIPAIADELGVEVVLEGGVQRVDNRIRINAQLIDGITDSHLWAETYDRELTAANIFAIQSEISLAIASALRATLTGTEQQAIAAVPTRNLDAYIAYSEARGSMDSLAEDDIRNAIEKFSEASRIDPDFAAAWAGTCTAYLMLYKKDSDRQFFDAAEASCQKALELDDTRVEVHVALGALYRYFGQYSRAQDALESVNYSKAEQSLEHALSLDQSQVEARIELGLVFAHQGRLQEAEAELKNAAELEPGSWLAQTALFSFYYTLSTQPGRFALAEHHARRSATLRPDLASSWNNLGAAAYYLGQYEEAAEAWKKSLAIEPNRTAYTNTGLAYFYSGDYRRAAEFQQKALELAPGDNRAMGRLADALRFVDNANGQSKKAYREAVRLAKQLLEVNERDWRTLGLLAVYQAHLGEHEEAQRTLQRALEYSDFRAEVLYNQALVNMQAGRTQETLEALQQAIEKDPDYRNLARLEPDFEPLAGQARFRELVTSTSG
ncbi:MAG: tetratricopeptide repeat protein [Xanthomonadales bacterium]|nr:tetratricopeptide repeat protein [Gammaproteobacteria bacterium]NNL95800.1 tetratricopeptide repeat protein [Xanthomonadales bacterium]